MSKSKRSAPRSSATSVKKVKLTDEEVTEVKKTVKPKVSARLAKKHKVATKPVLVFTSSYVGADTQIEAQAQALYFDQRATLQLDAGQPNSVSFYYDFIQEVRDSYTFHEGEEQDLTDWAWDDPYGPDYSDAQCDDQKTYISFKDEPGFSTTQRVAAGDWLEDYDVYFRWKVTHKASGTVWTSPSVHHSIRSEYDDGHNAEVDATAAGNTRWVVNLPDRT